MADHNELGKQGEQIAFDYLRKKGYKILERNYRFRHLEVDLIAAYDGFLVVVEVKTRNSDFMAGPEITVTKQKQKAIVKVANAYIHENEIDPDTRFDIISILLNQKQMTIEHFQDAFYPLI
jgi:putative endonuclease